MKHTIDVLDFKPHHKNTLRGFADIRIRELRLVIRDVALHEKGEARWAQLPAKPWFKNGVHLTDHAGKPQYSPILEFENRETRDAFSAAVWRAVIEFTPELVS